VVLGILALTGGSAAQNNTTSQGFYDTELEVSFCESVDGAATEQGCEEDKFSVEPVKLAVSGLGLFVAGGLFLKFFRVFVLGRPF
jgi:hypothetical protein